MQRREGLPQRGTVNLGFPLRMGQVHEGRWEGGAPSYELRNSTVCTACVCVHASDSVNVCIQSHVHVYICANMCASMYTCVSV